METNSTVVLRSTGMNAWASEKALGHDVLANSYASPCDNQGRQPTQRGYVCHRANVDYLSTLV